MNDPAPAPKKTQVFNPCLCTGLSSTFLFAVLSAFRLCGWICFLILLSFSFLSHAPRLFPMLFLTLCQAVGRQEPCLTACDYGDSYLQAHKVSVCHGKTWGSWGLWSRKTYVTAFMPHLLRSPKLCHPTDACLPGCSLLPWHSQWMDASLLFPFIHLTLPGKDGQELQTIFEF